VATLFVLLDGLNPVKAIMPAVAVMQKRKNFLNMVETNDMASR